MEDPTTPDIMIVLVAIAGAAFAAAALAYIAHYSLGLSRMEIRVTSMVVAGAVAVLLGVGLLSEKFGKQK